MKLTNVKEYLSQAYYIDKRIDTLNNELIMLESKLCKCTANYNSAGHSNNTRSAFEYTIDKVMQYRDRLNNEINNLVDKKNDIKRMIDKLDNDKEKIILHKRYINFQTFESIAEDLELNPRQIYRIHKKSLEKLQNVIECQ